MNCLYCYQKLGLEEADFHPACSRKMFGRLVPPQLDYTEDQMTELALQVVRSHIAVTGVQPKLSLDIEGGNGTPPRFTIVGLWGNYILKPPVQQYLSLPEVEDLTMHLASIAGIDVVPHSLIRLKSGNLAYITRRIDRVMSRGKGKKIAKLHMEDMCQITGKLSEDKYRGSHEQIAKALLLYSTNPVLDVINFYEQVVFSYLIGNADGHLKNFSLLVNPEMGYVLAPAYDMVSTALVNPADNEELALTLNGRKRKLKRADFESAFKGAKLDASIQRNIFNRFTNALPKWYSFIEQSFLNDEMKVAYKEIIQQRASQLGV